MKNIFSTLGLGLAIIFAIASCGQGGFTMPFGNLGKSRVKLTLKPEAKASSREYKSTTAISLKK